MSGRSGRPGRAGSCAGVTGSGGVEAIGLGSSERDDLVVGAPGPGLRGGGRRCRAAVARGEDGSSRLLTSWSMRPSPVAALRRRGGTRRSGRRAGPEVSRRSALARSTISMKRSSRFWRGLATRLMEREPAVRLRTTRSTSAMVSSSRRSNSSTDLSWVVSRIRRCLRADLSAVEKMTMRIDAVLDVGEQVAGEEHRLPRRPRR